MELIERLGLEFPRPVWALFTCGRRDRQSHVAHAYRRAGAKRPMSWCSSLPWPNGGLKTSRKGVGRFHLEVQGRPAHAGSPRKKAEAPSSSSLTRSCGSSGCKIWRRERRSTSASSRAGRPRTSCRHGHRPRSTCASPLWRKPLGSTRLFRSLVPDHRRHTGDRQRRL